MGLSIKIGACNNRRIYSSKRIEIKPVEDLREKIRDLTIHPQSFDGWVYPDIVSYCSQVDVPTYQFSVCATQVLSILDNKATLQEAEFLCLVYAFINGVRCYPVYESGWNQMLKTPYEKKLVRFICNQKGEVEFILEKALSFWRKRENRELRHSYFGALHWYLFSQSYEFTFDEFNWQYVVLDTLHKVTQEMDNNYRIQRHRHSERPSALCRKWNINIPVWARVQRGACILSKIRNNLVHEGVVDNQPLGFSHIPDREYKGIKDLNQCLLLAVIGCKAGIFNSFFPWNRYVYDTNIHGLNLAM